MLVFHVRSGFVIVAELCNRIAKDFSSSRVSSWKAHRSECRPISSASLLAKFSHRQSRGRKPSPLGRALWQGFWHRLRGLVPQERSRSAFEAFRVAGAAKSGKLEDYATPVGSRPGCVAEQELSAPMVIKEEAAAGHGSRTAKRPRWATILVTLRKQPEARLERRCAAWLPTCW